MIITRIELIKIVKYLSEALLKLSTLQYIIPVYRKFHLRILLLYLMQRLQELNRPGLILDVTPCFTA